MSVINLTNINGTAVPAPAIGEVNIFSDSTGNLSYKKDNGEIKVFGALFGQGFSSKKKTLDQTTTQTAFQTYDNLTVPAAGNNYFVMIRYVWGYSDEATDFRSRFLINGVQNNEEHRQEPKDKGADQRLHFSTFTVAQPSLGQIVIDLEFASGDGGKQARMYESEIFIWRID